MRRRWSLTGKRVVDLEEDGIDSAALIICERKVRKIRMKERKKGRKKGRKVDGRKN